MRGRNNFSQGREGFQDQGRRGEGARAPSHPSGTPIITFGPGFSPAFLPCYVIGIACLGREESWILTVSE